MIPWAASFAPGSLIEPQGQLLQVLAVVCNVLEGLWQVLDGFDDARGELWARQGYSVCICL